MIETVRRVSRNVTHWSSGDMCLRWTAAGRARRHRSHADRDRGAGGRRFTRLRRFTHRIAIAKFHGEGDILQHVALARDLRRIISGGATAAVAEGVTLPGPGGYPGYRCSTRRPRAVGGQERPDSPAATAKPSTVTRPETSPPLRTASGIIESMSITSSAPAANPSTAAFTFPETLSAIA